ncbi:MAG: phosphate propanoyltransferase [Firmicutes bacterium]|nr:phosphate propanoyltransferase [Bacillota bacterium]
MPEEELIKFVVQEVLERVSAGTVGKKQEAKISTEEKLLIPVASSSRHCHLSREDLDVLFGKDYQLSKLRDLSQPGQFAASECVTVVGPKGVKENVRILGPERKESQVEISITDCYALGYDKFSIRDSGDHRDSSGITIAGPAGAVTLKKGVIVAQRHLHATPDDAKRLGVENGEFVRIAVEGERGLVFEKVFVRVRHDFKLELHLDTDEANACAFTMGMKGKLLASG